MKTNNRGFDKKSSIELIVVAHAFNPSIKEAKADELKASLAYIASSRPPRATM